MCASWIMLTSFAPSPIAKVILSLLSLIRRTTCAFCFGVTRQMITESHSLAISRNLCLNWILSRICNDSPSTMIAHCCPDYRHSLIMSSLLVTNFSTSSIFFELILCRLKLCCMSLQLIPIFSAVSSLSPVSIQTLISSEYEQSCDELELLY